MPLFVWEIVRARERVNMYIFIIQTICEKRLQKNRPYAKMLQVE